MSREISEKMRREISEKMSREISEEMDALRDSIETAVTLKLYRTTKDAANAHLFKSKRIRFPLAKAWNLGNFKSARLSPVPFPVGDRPRGSKDLTSVRFHRSQIRKTGDVAPPDTRSVEWVRELVDLIWIAMTRKGPVLLDGAHRLIAAYLEHKRSVPAFIVG